MKAHGILKGLLRSAPSFRSLKAISEVSEALVSDGRVVQVVGGQTVEQICDSFVLFLHQISESGKLYLLEGVQDFAIGLFARTRHVGLGGRESTHLLVNNACSLFGRVALPIARLQKLTAELRCFLRSSETLQAKHLRGLLASQLADFLIKQGRFEEAALELKKSAAFYKSAGFFEDRGSREDSLNCKKAVALNLMYYFLCMYRAGDLPASLTARNRLFRFMERHLSADEGFASWVKKGVDVDLSPLKKRSRSSGLASLADIASPTSIASMASPGPRKFKQSEEVKKSDKSLKLFEGGKKGISNFKCIEEELKGNEEGKGLEGGKVVKARKRGEGSFKLLEEDSKAIEGIKRGEKSFKWIDTESKGEEKTKRGERNFKWAGGDLKASDWGSKWAESGKKRPVRLLKPETSSETLVSKNEGQRFKLFNARVRSGKVEGGRLSFSQKGGLSSFRQILGQKGLGSSGISGDGAARRRFFSISSPMSYLLPGTPSIRASPTANITSELSETLQMLQSKLSEIKLSVDRQREYRVKPPLSLSSVLSFQRLSINRPISPKTQIQTPMKNQSSSKSLIRSQNLPNSSQTFQNLQTFSQTIRASSRPPGAGWEAESRGWTLDAASFSFARTTGSGGPCACRVFELGGVLKKIECFVDPRKREGLVRVCLSDSEGELSSRLLSREELETMAGSAIFRRVFPSWLLAPSRSAPSALARFGLASFLEVSGDRKVRVSQFPVSLINDLSVEIEDNRFAIVLTHVFHRLFSVFLFRIDSDAKVRESFCLPTKFGKKDFEKFFYRPLRSGQSEPAIPLPCVLAHPAMRQELEIQLATALRDTLANKQLLPLTQSNPCIFKVRNITELDVSLTFLKARLDNSFAITHHSGQNILDLEVSATEDESLAPFLFVLIRLKVSQNQTSLKPMGILRSLVYFLPSDYPQIVEVSLLRLSSSWRVIRVSIQDTEALAVQSRYFLKEPALHLSHQEAIIFFEQRNWAVFLDSVVDFASGQAKFAQDVGMVDFLF